MSTSKSIQHFNPRPPQGGRPDSYKSDAFLSIFQSTPPARGATPGVHGKNLVRLISIHAPREGGDDRHHIFGGAYRKFQSTPPARGATDTAVGAWCAPFISIHAPREGGDESLRGHGADTGNFNPRPPRGGRPWSSATMQTAANFNPRPPRGGRQAVQNDDAYYEEFQSTPPARGATIVPCVLEQNEFISIHAPREGGDPLSAPWMRGRSHFNPRPPRGGRPPRLNGLLHVLPISIHAPCEGGDTLPSVDTVSSYNFNPRPPRGGRPLISFTMRTCSIFQSTPPARGATDAAQFFPRLVDISIHAPREGGDCGHCDRLAGHQYFNPRPPRGGRLFLSASVTLPLNFNPRPPRGGRLASLP